MNWCKARAAAPAAAVVVPFVPAHLADIEPPALAPGQLCRFAAAYRPRGPAFTVMEGGQALGCGGLIVDGAEAWAWAFLSAALRQRPLLLHRTVKRALPALARHHGLRTVDAEAHADFHAAHSWLERLGFQFQETVPRFAGTTEHYARYRLWVQ